MEEELEDEAWRHYVANILCMIARPQYESTIPMYTDLMSEKKPESNMTSEEIYNQVMGKLDELIAKEG